MLIAFCQGTILTSLEWGKPDTSENSTACWKLGNGTTLVVSYKNNGIVAICGLKDDSDASIGEYKFQFVAPLRIASAVLYFCIAWLYSLFSDGLVDINLYSLVFLGKEFVKGTIFPAHRISPQPAGTLVT